MSTHFISTSLETISTDQLPGVIAASTLLCLACLLITRLLRHRSASMTSSVWQATCSAILVSAVVLVLIPGIPLRNDSTAQNREASGANVSTPRRVTTATSLSMELPSQMTTSPISQQAPVESQDPPSLDAGDNGLIKDAQNQSPAAAATSIETSADVEVEASSTWIFGFAELLAGAWLGILVILLAGFLRSIMACRAITARSSKAIPTNIVEAAEAACQQLGIAPMPRLFLSDEVQVPFTAGTLRPVIVLPTTGIEWSREKLQMVIAHELAHIERHDVLWHWIGRLAICVAWFNPLVWWAARRGALDRERACDDRVIGCGFQGLDYGQCLVEIAAAVSGRIIPVTAAVSMAEPPMKLRLLSILSSSADRRRESKSYRGFVMATFVGLAVLLGIVRPLATAPAANSTVFTQPPDVEKQADLNQDSATVSNTRTTKNSPSDDETILLTQPVTGTITDEEGNPIAGAKVLVKAANLEGRTRIRTWQITTDVSGRYTLDISKLGKQPLNSCIGVQTADKSGFAQGRGEDSWQTLKEVADSKEIKATKLMRGRLVTGQIFASSGKPIGGIVKAWARFKSEDTWMSSGTEIGNDGKLEIYVPADSDADLVIYAADHSPIFVAVPPDKSDVGETTLPSGTIVRGQVVDRLGDPVTGVVVELESHRYRLPFLFPAWSRVAVTDGSGAFTLQPASGECVLSVRESAEVKDGIGDFESTQGTRPPLIAPLEIALTPDRSVHYVVMQESDSYRVSGTVKWDDGEPVKGLEVVGGVSLSQVGQHMTTVRTDAKGHYELRLPKVAKVTVMVIGAYRDSDNIVWCMAHGIPPAPFKREMQVVELKNLTGDVDDMDWELRPYRSSATQTAESIPARQAFEELEAEERQQAEKYDAATSPEEQDQLDPRNVMAPKYLAFEEEFRGSKQAMQAIKKVLQGANNVADPGSAAAKARIEMVERLIDHYLGHEDLATAFSSLSLGPPVPRADDLLRWASGSSPYPVVRAAAMLTRAERAKNVLRAQKQLPELQQYVAMLKDNSTWHPVGTKSDSVKRMADSAQQRLDELKAIDEADLRAQAGRWLDAIDKDYADLIRPLRSEHTFGMDATALRFAIDNVNDGQPAPQIEATDVNGKRFRLSDQQGKVVVLTFQLDLHNKVENLPDQNLAELVKDQAVELVTIVSTEKQDAFVENTKAASYHGTLIWEPLRGPYHSNWGVTGFPTTYIIDQTGILHAVPFGMDDVSGLVKAMIKE